MLVDDLKEARRSGGWSQRTLAKRIGVQPQAILRLEQGVGSVATLIRVMDALDFHLIGIGPGSTLAEQLRLCRLSR